VHVLTKLGGGGGGGGGGDSDATHIALSARLVITPLTLNNIVKNEKCCDKCYTQCGRFSYKLLSQKQSSLKEIKSLLSM
jgi:hypothetical protein